MPKPASRAGGNHATVPGHEVRRFESAVWSLYMLAQNPNLPAACRAACKVAADHALARMEPGTSGVGTLVAMAVEVGGAREPPGAEALLEMLRGSGWRGGAPELAAAQEALKRGAVWPSPEAAARLSTLEWVLAALAAHLVDPDLAPLERKEFEKALEEIRASKDAPRARAERAWALLDALEGTLYDHTRETGEG